MSRTYRHVIDQATLHRVLHYNAETGIFTWKEKISKKVIVGKVAGHSDTHGYNLITIYGTLYRSHRLAFIYMTGKCPEFIDHIDGNGTNNSWDNLRAATKHQNSQNTKLRRDSSTGYKGVCFDKQRNKWKVQIRANDKRRCIGHFDNIEEAAKAREVAARLFHGEFARFS